jgi:hypothetical protein
MFPYTLARRGTHLATVQVSFSSFISHTLYQTWLLTVFSIAIAIHDQEKPFRILKVKNGLCLHNIKRSR